MPSSTMTDFFGFLSSLMTQHADLFVMMGSRMFRAFATILIVWFGLKTALASAGGGVGPGFHWDRFAELLMTVSFGFAMINFYAMPIPGIGVSFYHLIVDQGLDLANQLDHSMVQEVWDR